MRGTAVKTLAVQTPFQRLQRFVYPVRSRFGSSSLLFVSLESDEEKEKENSAEPKMKTGREPDEKEKRAGEVSPASNRLQSM
jgi:hypothetical protein